MPIPLESSFEKLLVLLVKSDVRFITVGGIAVCLNGYVRLTEDVDILIDPAEENVRKLIDTLCSFGEGYAAELTIDDFSDEEGAIRLIEAIENCQIDIFVRMQGLHLEDFSEDTRYFETSTDVQIPYLSSKGLIKLKSKSLREKDRLDVSILQDMQRSTES